MGFEPLPKAASRRGGRLGQANARLLAPAALATAALLSACSGSGPSDSDIGQAMLMASTGGKPDKDDKLDKAFAIKGSKCAKGEAQAWECDFAFEGSGRHGKFAKTDAGWALQGSLR